METNLQELADSALKAYRTSLGAMAACGSRACPPIGPGLEQSLRNLQERLASGASPAVVADTEAQVAQKLESWSTEASEFFKQRAAEVKQIVKMMARTAETVGERDVRYTREFGTLSARLNAVAELDDLGDMRQQLSQTVTELNDCVSRMALAGQESVAQLRTELSTYQSKLEEAERLACRDALTGLDNRRKVEMQMELLTRRVKTFTILILDLNEFKEVNDRHGHLAGDEVLKQFARELRNAFRATDVVGRWGGDEFLVVMDCSLREAGGKIDRIRQWAFGEYKIPTPAGPVKVPVSASVGMAAWREGESIEDAIARADAAMYAEKSAQGRKR
jgi:diguanylate cyclase (GGDEF)-like protein